MRQETQAQKSQIHFFSSKIEDLEKQLSKLKDFDKKIRIIANLERGQETTSLMGMGGPSPSDIRDKLKSEKDDQGLVQQMRADVERLQSEAISQEVSLSELEKQPSDEERDDDPYALPLAYHGMGHIGFWVSNKPLYRFVPDARGNGYFKPGGNPGRCSFRWNCFGCREMIWSMEKSW